MKFLTIAIVVAMIALLPGYSHALGGKHHGGGGAGPSAGYAVAPNAGPDAPVSVPEPGSFGKVVRHEEAGEAAGATRAVRPATC